MFTMRLRGGAPIYEQLGNRITELILSGEMAEGEKLPAVREIATQLSINPNTVQKTYAELEEQAQALLGQMGLSDRADHYPHQLSGGQQQRVAIARALAMKPDILCFDEPTSALDPELTGEVLKVIRSLAEQKTTMIIVTHEMAFARDVSDQLIFMDGGIIVEQGNPHQVIDHPREERTRQFLSRYTQG